MRTRRVAEDTVNGYWVSTVELPFDHGFGGPPQLYETMIFPADKNGKVTSYGELYCERYATEEEAKAGHEKAVETAKEGQVSYDG